MPGKSSNPIVIDDSEEEDGQAVLSSAQTTSRKPPSEVSTVSETSSVENESTVPKPAAMGILGLNRAQMEQERLQRLGKRPASTVEHQDEPLKKKATIATSMAKPETNSTTIPSSSSNRKTLPFAKGVVRRTWAFGHPRAADDIKIEEVFQRAELQLALLSSFQWDEEWLLSKIDVGRTKLLLVAFANSEAQKDDMRSNAPPGVRFCFPPMHGPGSMHSKLQLLKYPTHLRVVVPTGNLVPYDWGETGVMENMLFLIDLPRLEDPRTHKPTDFSTQLDYFLRASDVDEAMVASLRNYDFSATAGLGFVCSIPGGHLNEGLKKIGYGGLATCMAALGPLAGRSVEIDMVCSSLGAVNLELVQALYNACRGDPGLAEYEARAARKQSSKSTTSPQSLIDHFRIYFPTDKTVRSSKGGRGAGGTICAQRKWWESPSFPRQLVRDCINTRKGILMHSKLIFMRGTDDLESSSSAKSIGGFAYVGSANLSESAWGRIVKDRATGKPKMSCRNWECGVVVPAAQVGGDEGEQNGFSIFEGHVPVPMHVPGARYEPDDHPWFFMEG